jgi:predicted TIM-barrel fold metal-dependent hydrolase
MSKIIDAHTHILGPDLANKREQLCQSDSWFGECYSHPKAKMVTVEQLLTSMDKAGVAMSVVTGFAFADQTLCSASNDYIIEAVQRYPERLIGLGAVQPQAGNQAIYEAERCLNAGLRGLGELLPDGQAFDVTSQDLLQDLATLLTKREAVMMVHGSEPVGHSYGGKGRTTPEKLLALATNFPDLKIIAAHWGGGLPFYELMPEVATALANVYYDSAATTYLYGFKVFRGVRDTAGLAKILFASDYPLLGQARLLERVRSETRLTEAELAAVLGDNAAQVFGLD